MDVIKERTRERGIFFQLKKEPIRARYLYQWKELVQDFKSIQIQIKSFEILFFFKHIYIYIFKEAFEQGQ